jgi:hypothetical protein
VKMTPIALTRRVTRLRYDWVGMLRWRSRPAVATRVWEPNEEDPIRV